MSNKKKQVAAVSGAALDSLAAPATGAAAVVEVVQAAVAIAQAEPKKSSVDILAEILLRQETVKVEDAQKKEARYKKSLANRLASSAATLKGLLRTQAFCDHQKGNHPNGEHPMKDDPNLYMHTFINGVVRITCGKCIMHWFKGDTQEFLLRNGKQIPNHTGMSFADARALLRRSTNKPSQAEIPMQIGQVSALANG